MPINQALLDNPKSDRVRRVADLARAKGRERSGRFLIEGPQSVREAVTWRPDVVQDLYVAVDDTLGRVRYASDTLARIVETSQDATIYVHRATREVIERISKDAQGILAVGNMNAMHVEPESVALPAAGERTPRIAAFWQVRDPGNAGTVIRAADAAGCDAVILVDECVDPLNPKVVRSTAGSLFHIPVLQMDVEGFLAYCAEHDLTTIAADVYGTPDRRPESLPALLAERADARGDDAEAARPGEAVLFGNEARGLPPEILARMDRIVSIPLYGKAESLNLGTSAAVMLMSLAMADR
ncbi:rRNA methyltransferase [Bifidobacterium sp. UTCIF-37]|uniref:TrmH family RNA methyltransferase n=1 Tax=unclassified Bifidobacterium TaxID=2608897 RepID=UPI0011288ABD|nr:MULTISPECIES: RNA methyltransferase [unclassified Bifidobacterium]TPF85418.1 rRNA methyltransferase [Bifidobacterium sp. UTCIF-37]TPF87478.1 rRNA methyltransferase [Bifidobacterium sp. UTCIF-38]